MLHHSQLQASNNCLSFQEPSDKRWRGLRSRAPLRTREKGDQGARFLPGCSLWLWYSR